MSERTDAEMATYIREHRCHNAARDVSIADWDRGIAALTRTEDVARLREALAGLVDGMEHGEDCPAFYDDDGEALDEPDDSRCGCGLSKARAALAAEPER